jgi:hypothetical protein
VALEEERNAAMCVTIQPAQKNVMNAAIGKYNKIIGRDTRDIRMAAKPNNTTRSALPAFCPARLDFYKLIHIRVEPKMLSSQKQRHKTFSLYVLFLSPFIYTCTSLDGRTCMHVYGVIVFTNKDGRRSFISLLPLFLLFCAPQLIIKFHRCRNLILSSRAQLVHKTMYVLSEYKVSGVLMLKLYNWPFKATPAPTRLMLTI